MQLMGTFTALVTPFLKNEEVDYVALKKLVQKQVTQGINGLVPCGTTGESPTLDHNEHRAVIAKTIEWSKEIRKDIIVIAGTGSNSTREAIDLTKAAQTDGADYALVVNPYYNKPTQEGLYQHFMKIADSSKIPIILYNIPGRTGISLTIDTIQRLSRNKNIVGIKEATGDLNFMAEVILNTDKDFVLLSGDDNLILPVLSIGGKGVISVISNIFPGEITNISTLFFEGKIEEARREFFKYLPLMKNMFIETNPIPVKAALAARHEIENILRLPMTSISEANFEKLRDCLKGFA